MSCKLIRDITHSCEYNAGGIKEIFLLDIKDFISYEFLNDGLYDTCFAERILDNKDSNYYSIDTVDSSSFSESNSDGIYKQELTTFVRTLNYKKTSDLLLASSNKYLVVLRTFKDSYFSFGSDGGASISFSQITGQLGDAEGYSININKNSIYPLIEINGDRFNKEIVLGTEDRIIVLTEDRKNAILI